jgi:signal transduction histidine kinase
VNANDGEISVRSTPGKGAEFTIVIPSVATDAGGRAAKEVHANSDR